MRSVIYILQNNAELVALLGSANQIGMLEMGQTKKTPYVVIDQEDSEETIAFDKDGNLDFVRFTAFCVADLSFTSGSTLGADELSKAVRKALSFVTPGEYDGEVITRCTIARGGNFRNSGLANKPEVTKEDEYLLSVRPVVEVAAPTDLALTHNYNSIFLGYSAPTADSINVYKSVNGGALTFLANTTDLTTYNDLVVGDDVKFLEYRIEAVVGTQKSTRVSVDYLTWPLNPDLLIDARDVDQYDNDGTKVNSYESLDENGVLFDQTAPSQRPDMSPTATEPTEIVFNGANSNALTNTADVAKFAAMKEGSVTLINGSTLANAYSFTIGDSTTTSDWLYTGTTAAGKPVYGVRANSVTLTNTAIDAIPVSDTYEWRKENGVVKLYVKGIEVAHTENHNLWFSDIVGADNLSIGRLARSIIAYSNVTLPTLTVKGNPLSDERTAEYHAYLTQIHS